MANVRTATHFVVERDAVTISKEIIGKGHSSDVFKASIKRPGGVEEVAAKRVRRDADEIKILKRLDHKNIITFHGTVPALEGLDTFILMEIAEKGDLYDYLRKQNGPVPIPLRWKWILQAAWAIQYIHEEGLVHKDIKSPNFLIMADNTLKLGDFGLTKEICASQTTHGTGTERWMAPELVIEQMRSKKSDVYSYGVVVWEMQTGEIPFKDTRQVTIAVFQGERLSIPRDCHPKIQHILECCLESDYNKRTTMNGVLDIIENYNPERYGTSDYSCDAEQQSGDNSGVSEQEQVMDFDDNSADGSLTPDTINYSSESNEKSSRASSCFTDPMSSADEMEPSGAAAQAIYRPDADNDTGVLPSVLKNHPRSGNTRETMTDKQLQQKELYSAVELEGECNWCKCQRCKPMPTEIERICCNADQCLSLDPKIEEFLDEVRHSNPYKQGSDVNKYYSELRGKTYRLFVAWRHGKMGPHKRVPIPSCCVWKIRKYYPDSKNKYTGYAPCSPK